MNILSLCTGYGGLDLAVEAVIPGAVTRWVSDIDRDACAVQAVRFPKAEQLGDLKAIDWQALAGQVDVITAGYPCQPFSTAGRRQGVDDDRHIWPWIIRGIRLVGPRLVVLENVAGHLALGFDTVLGDLAEAGLNAEWVVVRAADAGAPHRRERIFVVAHPDGRGQQGESKQHGASQQAAADWPARRRHVDRRGLEAPADSDSVGRERTVTGASRHDERGDTGHAPTADADADGTARHGRTGLPDPTQRLRPPGCGQTDWRQFGPAIERWERHMGRAAPAPLVDGTRQLNARFVEWMMGLDDGWVTDIILNRRALKVLGNGVVPQQAALALRMLL